MNRTYLTTLSRRGMLQLTGAAAVGLSGMAVLLPGAALAAEGEPASASTLPWPAAGAFGGKAIVGPHQPSAAAMLSTEPVLGLPAKMRFIYGCLRDDDGNLSEWLRNFNIDPELKNGGLFLQSSLGKDALRAVPEVFTAAADTAVSSTENGAVTWRSPEGARGKPFRLTMAADGTTVNWREEGILDVTGELLGPGLQWYIAALSGSELYVSQIYEMKGTALGKPVRGVMAFDKVYLPDGMKLYGGKDPLFREQSHHRAWYTWGTRYEDGGYDAGHFVLGTDRIGFALLTNERQQLVLDTDVTGQVELVANEPWPRRITVRTSAGAEWEFLPDPKGRMPDMLNTGVTAAFTPQCEGRWRRVGDTRKPVAWFAWGEVQSADRIAYSQHSRF